MRGMSHSKRRVKMLTAILISEMLRCEFSHEFAQFYWSETFTYHKTHTTVVDGFCSIVFVKKFCGQNMLAHLYYLFFL